MSEFKDTNITNPGTPIKYGADDMEVIARLFNGVTSGIPPVTIKSSNKFGFWDGIMYVRNQADTFNTTIRGAAVQTNHRDLALPSITANDTLAAIGLKNVFSVAQQLELGTLFKQMSAPSNPSSNYHHLYVNGSGQLVKRNSTGAEEIFTNVITVGQTTPLKDYDARVFESGGVYYAYDKDGAILASGSVLETVAQAAIDNTGTVVFLGNLTFSAGFTGLTVNSYTNVVIPQQTNLNVLAGYTGVMFKIVGNECRIKGQGGYLNEIESGSAKNWTAIQIGTGTVTDNIYDVEISGIYGYLPGTFIQLNQGSGGSIHNILIENCTTAGFKKGIVWTTSVTDKIRDITIRDLRLLASSATTTDIFKDVAGTRNTFIANQLSGITAGMNETNITANAVDTVTIGGNHTGVIGTFTDSSTTTMHFNANGGLKVRSGYLNVKNPAGTFYTRILGGDISAARDLNLPAITGTDTLAALGLSQTWTALQNIRVSSEDALDLQRTSNTIGNRVNIDFALQDSALNMINYARIAGEIVDPTNTSEDGKLLFHVRIADVLSNCLTIDQTGALLCGGPNTRIKFAETGLNGVRTYTLPDSSTQLAGISSPNIFLDNQTIQTNETDLLNLYRPSNAVNDIIDLNFDFNNSVGTKTTYGDIRCTLVDPTDASEDARFSLNLMKAGTKNETLKLDQFGTINLYNNSNTQYDENGIYFDAKDSGGNRLNYGAFSIELQDTTDASEDGDFIWDLTRGGTSQRVMFLDNMGKLEIGRDNSNRRAVPSYIMSSSANVSFASSVAENTILSFTLKGNVLGIDGRVCVRAFGNFLQNQATGTTFTVRVKWAGTTIYQDDFGGTLAQSGTQRPWQFELNFFPNSQSTSSGRMGGLFVMNNVDASQASGQGSIADDEIQVSAPVRATGVTINSTVDQTIAVTVQMSVNNANVQTNMDYYSAEFIQG